MGRSGGPVGHLTQQQQPGGAEGDQGHGQGSLTPQGLRAQQAYQELGYKVTTVQPRPALVTNYRPWIEQMKQSGAKADFEITAQDPTPIFNAMNDTGFKPEWNLDRGIRELIKGYTILRNSIYANV